MRFTRQCCWRSLCLPRGTAVTVATTGAHAAIASWLLWPRTPRRGCWMWASRRPSCVRLVPVAARLPLACAWCPRYVPKRSLALPPWPPCTHVKLFSLFFWSAHVKLFGCADLLAFSARGKKNREKTRERRERDMREVKQVACAYWFGSISGRNDLVLLVSIWSCHPPHRPAWYVFLSLSFTHSRPKTWTLTFCWQFY